MKAFLAALMLMVAVAAHADCAYYTGYVYQDWPDGSYSLKGNKLYDYKPAPYVFTWTLNKGDAQFQMDFSVEYWNIVTIQMDSTACTFSLEYEADPIFRGNFDDPPLY